MNYTMSLGGRKAKLREFLDQIDEMLSHQEVGGDLADVLSCVRGPDQENDYFTRKGLNLKAQTITSIRKAAFPKTCTLPFNICDFNYAKNRWSTWQETQDVGKVNCAESTSEHFTSHVKKAAAHLGLLDVQDLTISA